MKDKKTLGIILSSVIIILIVILIIISHFNTNEGKLKIVDDYTIFFTVDDCVNNFLNYVTEGERDILLNLLNTKYKKENNISENNILEKIDNLNILNNNVTFRAKMMYEKRNNKYIEYYVYGKIYKDDMDEIKYLSDYYIIININTKEKTFSVTPYDGKVFKEGI